MSDLLVPCLSYALLMSFTPGPNNVSSSALGLRAGYRGSLPYLLGITSGFLVIMLCGGVFTEFLTKNYAAISPWLKWVGVAYMIWLAVSLFLLSPGKKAEASEDGRRRRGIRGPLGEGFVAGFLLQFVNPKGILYGVTIYTSFAALLTGSLAKTLASASILTVIGFAAVSTWCLVGSALSRLFARNSFRFAFNILMALLLAYSALSIALH